MSVRNGTDCLDAVAHDTRNPYVALTRGGLADRAGRRIHGQASGPALMHEEEIGGSFAWIAMSVDWYSASL